MNDNNEWYLDIPVPTKEDLNDMNLFEDKFSNLFCYFNMLYASNFKTSESLKGLMYLNDADDLKEYTNYEVGNALDIFGLTIVDILCKVIIPLIFKVEIEYDDKIYNLLKDKFETIEPDDNLLESIATAIDTIMYNSAYNGMTVDADADIQLAAKAFMEIIAEDINEIEYSDLYKEYLKHNPIED